MLPRAQLQFADALARGRLPPRYITVLICLISIEWTSSTSGGSCAAQSFESYSLLHLPGGIKTELKASRLLPSQSLSLRSTSSAASWHASRNWRLRLRRHEGSGGRRRKRRSESWATKSCACSHAELREWIPGHLGDYVLDIRYGTSDKCHDEALGTPVFRMGNIQDGQLDIRQLNTSSPARRIVENYY